MRHRLVTRRRRVGDKDYDLIWFVETCLHNALRMEQFIDAALIPAPDLPVPGSSAD